MEKEVLKRAKGWVLSYWPIGAELDIRSLNRVLADEKRLFLPAVEKDRLVPYLVEKPDEQLKLSHMRIWEPDVLLCSKEEMKNIGTILIPGLAFDRENYRLGYGEGWYDRLLGQFPMSYSIGIGYLEQLSLALLPRDAWDKPVAELILF